MQILDRIINISAKKNLNNGSVTQKTEGLKAGKKSGRGKIPTNMTSPNKAETKNKIKEVSKTITIETHAANLQRKVYILRNDNDKLKMELHNSQQNYISLSQQLMALQQLNEQSLASNQINIPKFNESQVFGRVINAPQYEVTIAEKYAHNLISNSKCFALYKLNRPKIVD